MNSVWIRWRGVVVGFIGAVLLVSMPCASGALQPEKQPAASAPAPDARYIRTVEKDGGDRLVMQSAARTFVRTEGSGPAVTMCAAVHIADKSFYEKLQALLDAKDVVLFESVKPSGTGRPEHDLSGDAGDEQKAKITKMRIRMLGIAARAQKLKNGEFPASVEALIAGLSPKLRPYVNGVTTDGWGRALVYERTAPPPDAAGADSKKADDAAAPKRPVRDRIEITSLGADGKLGGDGMDADLRLSEQRPIKSSEVPRVDTKGIQSEMASALGLVFQLDAMTHEHANWRNSDLSVDQVQERMAGGPRPKKRAKPVDSAPTKTSDPAASPAKDAPKVSNPDADADDDSEDDADESTQAEQLFKMLDGSSFQAGLVKVVLGLIKFIPGGQMMGKLALVEALGRADELLASVPGMDRMLDVIIKDRNEVVAEDLGAIIEKEKTVKTVGIIYGGGHMPDLEKRLRALGYKESGVKWLDAITIEVPRNKAERAQFDQIRTMVGSTLDQQIKAMKRPKGGGAAEP